MKQNEIMFDAALTDIAGKADAQSLNRWVGEILGNETCGLKDRTYHAVFRGTDIDGAETLIGACGRLCGFRIYVSHSGIEAVLDLPDGSRETVSEPARYETVPFGAVFAVLNRMHGRLKELIPAEFGDVPVIGGIESVFLTDEPQRIADYYLPELVCFGAAPRFRMFRASHLAADLTLPQDGTAEPYRTGCKVIAEAQYPDRDRYMEKMPEILGLLKSDVLQKIVVSRMDEVRPEGFDLYDFTAYLLDRYYQEYFYCFGHGDGTVWTGISPEVIMKQRGTRAMTKPLAGTRKKTGDPEEDARLREDLVSTEKDIVEHEHALYHMYDQLKGADIGAVEILKNKAVLETPYTLHLMSELSVALKPGKTPFDMIGALYPPATIWGIPVDETERALPLIENYRRGFFTGVFGYFTANGDANTALVIRSCSITGDKVRIYAGGGVVKYSVPEDEFDETVNKMRPIRSYFGA
ncbi:MAG: chorismate-binding protein [Clostridia bacterium]|nr:chorismate-binding protein [Clostridia bacterium]